jgi:release factor glutamine methyltransferase
VTKRLDEVLRDARRFLQSHRVPDASANAEFLLSHLMGFKRLELYVRGDRTVTTAMLSRYRAMLERRASREPLPYLLGEHDFMGLRLRVTPDVLIPRPETEGLVKKAMPWIRKLGSKSLVDVGTGSGCIAIAMARFFPHLKVYATDICLKALKVARENGRTNEVLAQVRWVAGDLFRPDPSTGLRSIGPVDAIISNPPYVPREVLPRLAPEIQKEPRVALDGGSQGIQVLGRLIAEAPRKLRKGGFLLLEFGDGQGPAIQELFVEAGFVDVAIDKDLSGLDRYGFGRIPEAA